MQQLLPIVGQSFHTISNLSHRMPENSHRSHRRTPVSKLRVGAKSHPRLVETSSQLDADDPLLQEIKAAQSSEVLGSDKLWLVPSEARPPEGNLTNSSQTMDDDLVEETGRLANDRQPPDEEDVPDQPSKTFRYKDHPDFQEHVGKNLWADRRENGFPWRCDVFDFIRDVYAPFLGQGLLQSDIKACDPKLYAQLHQQLTVMEPEAKSKTLRDLKLPSEFDARLGIITDEAAKEQLLVYREWERKRSRDRRLSIK